LRARHLIFVGLISVVVGTEDGASQPVDRTAPQQAAPQQAAPQQAAPQQAAPQQGVVCPPDVKGTAPTIGGDNRNLGDRLAQSKGVICPPAGVDPGIQVTPPGGGELKVIPAPGTPGGNPNVQPK